MNPLIGKALISGGASLLSGIFGNSEQSRNLDRQLQFQKEENQKNREYNLMLAQKQNAWNIEQWERENDYNSPEAVMERLRKGNVNPDLFYGGGASNMSASSPMLTSGAPSSPVDMSPLGQKPTLGQAIRQSLHDSLLGAQIENIKADTDRKNLDNDVQRELHDLLGLDFKDVDGVNVNYLSPQAQKYIYELRDLKRSVDLKDYENHNKSLDTILRDLHFDMEKKVSEKEWKELSSRLDKSIQECKEFISYAALRLRGLKADVTNKEGNAEWNSPEMLKSLPDGLPLIVKFLRAILGK